MKALWRFLTAYEWRRKRETTKRRGRYEFLKAKISERHFAGFRGLVVDFPGFKFDKTDQCAFKSPMYVWLKNKDAKWCLFWERGLMTAEIGVGGELKDGETMIPDRRENPISPLQVKPETVDETAALVVKVEPKEA